MMKLHTYILLSILVLLSIGYCSAQNETMNIPKTVQKIDFAPFIAAPKNLLEQQNPLAYKTTTGFALENQTLKAEFSTNRGLKLISLKDKYIDKNILQNPAQNRFFLIEIGGQRFTSGDWSVTNIDLHSNKEVDVQLRLEQYKLDAKLSFVIENDSLKMGLEIKNQAAKTQRWKSSFPQITDIAISKNPKDDYYLFPFKGGIVNRVNSDIRAYYGGNSAWWQMMDVFSPETGTGLSLRSLDDAGSFKGMAFRKGDSVDTNATLIDAMRGVAKDLTWENSLPASSGSSMGFEYNTNTVQATQNVVYPDALISVHSGDWHAAMETYARWAHQVWSWRPLHSKLDNVWNVHTLSINRGNPANTLFNGKWYDHFADDGYDMSEFVSWWDWADKGPFGMSLENAREEAGENFYKRFKSDLTQINPATGKRAYPYNRGDYEYNESWGGLNALRKEIKDAHAAGQLVQFYTDPFLVDDNTQFAKKYLPKFATFNPIFPKSPLPNTPKAGYDISFGQWTMCIDNQEYQNLFIQKMERIVHDTGVDSIRLDQMGGGGYPCYNPLHDHIFQKQDEITRLQASELLVRNMRKDIDKIKPDFLISTEYPGYDFLASQVDNSIAHAAKDIHPVLRPFPINIFRFYFPETKLYEYAGGNPQWTFWNAMGTFYHNPLPRKYTQILQDNADAFRSDHLKPLVPTAAEYVYANRFTIGNKEITLLYNDSGQKINGAVLAADLDQNTHYFDLLSGRELVIQDGAIRMNIVPGDVAAIAKLSKIMNVSKSNNGWKLKLSEVIPDASLVWCDDKGNAISTENIQLKDIETQDATIRNAAFVKLFRGKYLMDAVDLRVTKSIRP